MTLTKLFRTAVAAALVLLVVGATTAGCRRKTRYVVVNGGATSATLALTAPAAGAVVAAGTTVSIAWTSADLQTGERVTLSYSTDGGATFTTIVSNTDDDGAFDWTPPLGIRTAVIRIESETGSASTQLGLPIVLATVWYVDAAASGPLDGLSWATAFNRIQVAVDAAQPGEQVWVRQGTYTAFSGSDPAVVVLRARVAVYGGFDGTETQLSARAVTVGGSTIDAQSARRGVEVAEYAKDSRLDGFTVVNGSATAEGGGGLYALGADGLVVEGCVFNSNSTIDTGPGGGLLLRAAKSVALYDTQLTNNQAYSGGGAYFDGCVAAVVSNCTFSSNLARGEKGGAIVARGGGASTQTISVARSNFTSNSAPWGGAIALELAALHATIDDTTFKSNFSNGGLSGGGAIHSLGADTTVGSCAFTSNIAADTAGGIFAEGGTLDVDASRFTTNTADRGAALWVSNAIATLSRGTFTSNQATTDGGAVGAFEATLTVSDTTFDQNVALADAGAAYVVFGTLSAASSTFTGNTADRDGGAIVANNSALALTDCTLTGNQSDRDGGAVAAMVSAPNPGKTTITRCTLSGNTTQRDGGGMFNVNHAVTVSDSLLANNTAGRNGGGLEQIDVPSTIAGGTLDGNQANERGGGLHALGCLAAPGRMSLTLSQTTLDGNDVTQLGTGTLLFGGGGMFLDEYAVGTLSRADVIRNGATLGDGGGVLNMGGTLTLINTVVANNSAAMTGGGVYTAAWGKTTIEFSTIAGNTASEGAGIGLMTAGSIALGYPTVDVDSSIVWGNTPDAVGSFDGENPITVSYSDVQSGTLVFAGSNNNVGGDPLFVDSGSLDFHLQAGSAADGVADPTSPPATDHDGTPRPASPNMGAFE